MSFFVSCNSLYFKVSLVWYENFYSSFLFFFFFCFKFTYLLIILSALGLHCCAWASHCSGFSHCRARAPGTQSSVVVAHGLSNSVAGGIPPNQGLNPRPMHWQADSQPRRHQGSPPAFFWFPFAWNIFFYPLTFSLYVSLGLKSISCRQHIYGSCFCIHSASLCLLVRAFNPFIFKVIINMYVPIPIFLIVLGLLL